MFEKRIIVLVGHFGSGKTEIALRIALDRARAGGTPPALVDLDVVKPYFRSRGGRDLLEKEGVRLIAPPGENIYADLPIIMPQIRGVCSNRAQPVVMDVGGDDTGSRVLGSLSDVLPVDESELMLVLNFRRPFTPTVDAALEMAGEIQAAARRQVSGVISNTHLMAETTEEIIREGYRLAKETARRLGVALVAVTMEESMRARLDPGDFSCPLLAFKRIVRPPFEGSGKTRTTGPLFAVT